MSTSVYGEVTTRCQDLLGEDDRLRNVQILPFWPGDEMEDEAIWWYELESVELNVPVLTPDPKFLDDIVDVPFIFRTATGADPDDAWQRICEMLEAGKDVFRNASALGDVTVGTGHVVSAEIVGQQGPTCVNTKDGAVGFAQLTLRVHTRLSE